MATELGQAYVQIVPSAKGLGGAISNAIGPESERAGKVAGTSIVGKIKGVIAAAGIGAMIGKALNAGGELQQNLGGTEAVFGKFSKTIQTDANSAYKNMGMSASDYMATANKMGSLFQGSGIEQQKSLQLTSESMQRAADVASVMGVDTSMAMDSIAGAAKGNFTMMDNLGVAMNATSIEAYALEKGLNFKWKTATNAEKTELALKMFMDRTSQYAGNFAKEAEETFTGSLGAMKSAFTDVLAGISLGMDITPQLHALATTTSNFLFKNFFPMVINILKALPGAIGTFITSATPQFLQAGASMIQSIASGFGGEGGLATMLTSINNTINGIIEFIETQLPTFLAKGLEVITNLVDGVLQGIPTLITTFSTLLDTVLSTVTEKIPELLVKGIEIISNIVGGILQAMPTLISTAGQIVSTVLTRIIESLPKLATSGFNILMSVINGIMDNLPKLWEVAKSLVGTIATTIETNLPKLLTSGLQIISNILTGIKQNAPALLGKMLELVTKILGDIAKNLPQFIQRGSEMIVKMIRGIGEKAPEIISKIAETIVKLADKIREKLPMLLQKGKEIIINMIDGIIQNGPKILSQMATTVGNIALEIGKNLPKILAAGVKLILELLKGIVNTVPDIIAKIPELIGFMKDAFLKGVGSFFSIGANLIKGLWEGIGSVKNWIGDKIKGFAGGITNRVKNFFGINSPSRLFRDEIGSMIGKGLGLGILDEKNTVSKAMDKLEAETIRDMTGNVGIGFNNNSSFSGLEGTEFSDDALGINKQPAWITLLLGNNEFKAFVEDISNQQNKDLQFRLEY